MQADTSNVVERISRIIENQKEKFTAISDQIWEFAEVRFEEEHSANLLCDTLKGEGFSIERGVANLDTGFIGTYENGRPVIAILGEYDALAELSQHAGVATHDPVITNGNGHGCGHNLLGVGSLAGAIAVKDYLAENNLPGTVKYFGCPAEESGYGKTFMARDGLFKDVDIAFSWHPANFNAVMQVTSNGVIHANFKFYGRSAHAGASPHLGRSALDAVEIMNVGVNYLREHMIDGARIHYAVTNTGGYSPNVVQAEAEVTYLIRAPKPSEVKKLYERVVNCARGAALITETTVKEEIVGSCHNLIPNTTLEKVMHENMQNIDFPELTKEDVHFAKEIFQSLSKEEQESASLQVGSEISEKLRDKPIHDYIMPYSDRSLFMSGSTDVADVSWNVPTAQCTTSTWAIGTPFHTWQVVAQGKSNFAHNAMLLAGKTIASTAISAIENPVLIEKAKTELKQRFNGEQYEALIDDSLTPPRLTKDK